MRCLLMMVLLCFVLGCNKGTESVSDSNTPTINKDSFTNYTPWWVTCGTNYGVDTNECVTTNK